MSQEPEEISPRRSSAGEDGDDDRPARFLGSLGLERPLFEGPLCAFVIGGERRPGDPVLLGGDLHATHREAPDPDPGRGRDPSLASALISFGDAEHDPREVTAVDGIWCLVPPADQLDPAPYLVIWDSEGRLRAWLLLPPPPRMIGIAHLWLPTVPPPKPSPGTAGPGPGDPSPPPFRGRR